MEAPYANLDLDKTWREPLSMMCARWCAARRMSVGRITAATDFSDERWATPPF